MNKKISQEEWIRVRNECISDFINIEKSYVHNAKISDSKIVDELLECLQDSMKGASRNEDN